MILSSPFLSQLLRPRLPDVRGVGRVCVRFPQEQRVRAVPAGAGGAHLDAAVPRRRLHARQQTHSHRSQAGERPLRHHRLVRRLARHRRQGERRRRRRQQEQSHGQPADPQDAGHEENAAPTINRFVFTDFSPNF